MRKPDAVAQARPGAVAVAVPFCLMALVVGADLLAGPQIGLSLRAVVAGTTIVGVTAAGVLASVARQRKEHELVNVRAVADLAQRVLLRQVPRQVGQIRIAMRYISAAAAARIGGDLYDVVAVAGTVRLIVADVQGKGLAAIQTAAVVLASFRESAYDAPDLAGIAEHIELSLGHQAPGERFVTVIMAEVDQQGAEIRLLNCGHPAPLLVGGDWPGQAEPLEAALPLGLAGLEASERKEYTVPFGPDDRMLFYTDGISEARDKSGAFYPVDRCGALLGGPYPDAALGRLYRDVLGHAGGRLHDDSAALFVMRQPLSPRQEPVRRGGARPGRRRAVTAEAGRAARPGRRCR